MRRDEAFSDEEPDAEHPESLELTEEPADDRIIGLWVRRSLLALAAAGGVALLVGLWVRRPIEAPAEAAIEVAAPLEVDRQVRPPELPFTDVTTAAGIDFTHENGAAGEKLLPETMGSGVAFFDADNDGDPDLLLVNGRPWAPAAGRAAATSKLYANDGTGRFADVSEASGLAVEAYGTGVAVGDVDNDGWRDVFIAAVGSNRLLLNRGGRFVERPEAGVAGAETDWSTSAAFFDADNDGDLDLFVANYVRWSRSIDAEVDFRLTGVGRAYGPPINYAGTFSKLYRNRGDGTFDDVSAAAGLEVVNTATGLPAGKALGVAPVDVDRDGFVDLLVANDTVRNFFFHNRGDGTFEEVAELYGLAYGRNGEATGAMGVDSGQFRDDGELGFVIGNFANEMTSLYLSQGDATLYSDEAITAGIGAPSRTLLTFGVLFFDVDLDGRLDLLAANGHLENEIAVVDPSQSYEQPLQLFWNGGPEAPRTFVEVDPRSTGDLGQPLVGRGLSFADIDGDGDLDVAVTQTGRRAVVLRNDQELEHHWLRLRLVDPEGARDAIGAWVEVEAGGVLRRRQVMPTRGYQSQSELVVTVGLGAAEQVDAVRILWPDGTVQDVPDVEVDRLRVIEKAPR